MTKSSFYLILFLCGLYGLPGCSSTCICESSPGLRPVLISFTASETDTLILRKFVKGSDFTTQVDTLLIDKYVGPVYNRNDSADFSTVILTSRYDYEIIIPAVNRLLKITDINEPQRTAHCPAKTACVNVILSYKLDGQLITNDYTDHLYIKK